MTRCESYPPCFGTIYFPTAPCVFIISFHTLYKKEIKFFQRVYIPLFLC